MIRFFKILTFQLLLLQFSLSAQTPAESSVLSKGKWFKIAVTEDGIYRIDYSRLRQMGIDNPSNPRIFGNNPGQISYYNNETKPDDLKELAIFISGNDDVLNDNEYLLFYGEGTGRWIYNYETSDYSYLSHNYSDTAFYFITSAPTPGKRIIPAVTLSQTASYFSSESDARELGFCLNAGIEGQYYFLPKTFLLCDFGFFTQPYGGVFDVVYVRASPIFYANIGLGINLK